MAKVLEPISDAELKKITVVNLRNEYKKLANFYQRIMNNELIYCSHCGQWKSAATFYSSKTSPDGIEHYACKECILNECTDYDKKNNIRTDNREKTIETFRRLNWYFDENVYNEQLQKLSEQTGEKIRSTAVQQWIVICRSLNDYSQKTYKDSIFSIDDEDSMTETNKRIVQKTLKTARKRFGNYNNEDLMFLENEYQDWITRYECNTKAQETIFERLAFKKWEINKATKAGQNTKDLDKTYTDLLASINILPRQNADNGLDSSLTFGQLIEQWESTKPIPDPDPEFADVNHIGKYIKTWFKGSLARSLGIDNGYSKEYDDELQKYTVKKQDYSEDDESDDIYKSVFGDDTK